MAATWKTVSQPSTARFTSAGGASYVVGVWSKFAANPEVAMRASRVLTALMTPTPGAPAGSAEAIGINAAGIPIAAGIIPAVLHYYMRFVPGAEEYIREALDWCGLTPDESPWVGGPDGPYRQSDRKALYRQYADQLIAADKAYYAFDTSEELDAMRERLKAAGVAAPAALARSHSRSPRSAKGHRDAAFQNGPHP